MGICFPIKKKISNAKKWTNPLQSEFSKKYRTSRIVNFDDLDIFSLGFFVNKIK